MSDVTYQDDDQRLGGHDADPFTPSQRARVEAGETYCPSGEHYAADIRCDHYHDRDAPRGHTYRVTVTETVQTIYETRAYGEQEARAHAISQHLGPFESTATLRETHVLTRESEAHKLNQS